MKKFKTGSASYGIDFMYQDSAKRRWYRWHRFPLLPIYDAVESDEWNSASFSFSWLFLRLWSLDSFGFSAELHIEDIGIFLRFQLLYLNVYVWLIPFPERWHGFLSRSAIWRRINSESLSDRQ